MSRIIAGRFDKTRKVLREYGARDLGRAEGVWRNGWQDFDPRSPLMTPKSTPLLHRIDDIV